MLYELALSLARFAFPLCVLWQSQAVCLALQQNSGVPPR